MDPGALALLNEVAGRAPLEVSFMSDGHARLEPTAEGIDGALAQLLAVVFTSMAEGTWERLKACLNDACHWVFYDHSKNRSGTWCTMAVCGSRMKVRAYRQRQAEA